MYMLLGDLYAKVGKEDIFKPTFWNERLHKTSNDNKIMVVNSDSSKILIS
jgi:hypothetical protein